MSHDAVSSTVPSNARTADGHGLSEYETRLLDLLAAGRTNAQIALCTNRSDKTVSNQLTGLYAKLEVVNRAEAVGVYLRRRQWRDES